MILRKRVPLRLPRLGLLSVVLLALAALPAWAQKVVERNSESPATVTESNRSRFRRTEDHRGRRGA